MTLFVTTRKVNQTFDLGVALAEGLRAGDIILLDGPLGAGKTVLVRGVVAGLDPAVARLVSSPSYVIVGEYPTTPRVVHFDLYRLERTEEVIGLGHEELLYGEGRIVLVEWPALLEPLLEPDDPVLRLRFEPGQGPNDRLISLSSDEPRLQEAAQRAATLVLAK
jgi:tRNA threonylcarbamoyl adenosine modification protein YjeE